MVAWDCAAWLLALALVVVLRYDLALKDDQWLAAVAFTGAAIVLQIVGGFALQLYLGRSRLGSFDEATLLGVLVVGQSLLLGGGFVLLVDRFPRGMAIFLPVMALVFMGAGRWALRSLRSAPRRGRSASDAEPAAPALIYGAGDVGTQVATLVARTRTAPYRIVGFVDDDPGKRFLRVRKHRVLGKGSDAVTIAQEHGAEIIILAVTEIPSDRMRRLSEASSAAGITLIVVPPLGELINGQVSLAQLREFNVADLLGRRPIRTDLQSISGYLTGRVVLVTGAGGSIGSELALQVKRLGPAKLLLLDRDESALHGVQLSLYGSGLLDTDDTLLCSIRDAEALERVFDKHRPEVVLHAAALKHLPMLERFPEEGWKTNVLGTLNVLRCAERVGVRHFVNISTDKAADAASVLGQTKRLAERLTSWYAEQTGRSYLSVRFGNVLGSRGSVYFAFKHQIERGGPVTVTHPDVTRYFMTIPEACELVLQAGAVGRPGDVLVLDMGEPVKIVDVARRLISESGRSVAIEYTGLRPGEKLHEALFSDGERGTPSAHPLISRVPVPPVSPHEVSAICEPFSEFDLLTFGESPTA